MSSNKICFFCKNSGENEKTYSNHTKHTCQKLANIECLKCGAKGHTERYCDDSGRKYATHAKKPALADDEEWKEVSGGAKKTPLVFHIGNNTVTAVERPASPPKNDEETFPTLAEPVKTSAAKTLNFAALKFEAPKVVAKPMVVVSGNGLRELAPTTVTSDVADTDFPALPARPRRSPPARSPPPLPTIREVNETDVSNMTQDEVIDTINSNITATEMAERTAQQLTSVIATLSTSLQLVNSRLDAKCKEYDALLQAYNALAAVVQQQQTSQWGERGSSWADEPMN
jgi:hypothetical protein